MVQLYCIRFAFGVVLLKALFDCILRLVARVNDSWIDLYVILALDKLLLFYECRIKEKTSNSLLLS